MHLIYISQVIDKVKLIASLRGIIFTITIFFKSTIFLAVTRLESNVLFFSCHSGHLRDILVSDESQAPGGRFVPRLPGTRLIQQRETIYRTCSDDVLNERVIYARYEHFYGQ